MTLAVLYALKETFLMFVRALELRGSWGTQREDRGCTTSLKQPEQNSKLERVLESVAGDQYR